MPTEHDHTEVERLIQRVRENCGGSLFGQVSSLVETWTPGVFVALRQKLERAEVELERLAGEERCRGLPGLELEPEAATAFAEIDDSGELPERWSGVDPGAHPDPDPDLADLDDPELTARARKAMERCDGLICLTQVASRVAAERIRDDEGRDWAESHIGAEVARFVRGEAAELGAESAGVAVSLFRSWRVLGPCPDPDAQQRILRVGSDAGGAVHCDALLAVADMLRESGEVDRARALVVDCPATRPWWREQALVVIGKLAFCSGKLSRGAACGAAAVRLALRARHRNGVAAGLLLLGAQQVHLGEPRRTRTILLEALRLLRAVGDQGNATLALSSLAALASYGGDPFDAVRGHRSVLVVQRRENMKVYEATTLSNLGLGLIAIGEYREARGTLEEAIEACRHVGDRRGEAITLGHLAILNRRTGDYRRAAEIWHEVIDRHDALGDRLSSALGHVELAAEECRRENWSRSIELANEAIETFESLGADRWLIDARYRLAFTLEEAGRTREARDLFERCAHAGEELGDRRGAMASFTGAARSAFAQGDFTVAWELIQRACAELPEKGALAMQALHARGAIAAAIGAREEALASYNEAAAMLESLLRESGPAMDSVLDDALPILEEQVALLLSEQAPDHEEIAAAFRVAEWARARSLMESIHRRDDPAVDRSGPLGTRRRRVEARLRALQKRLIEERAAPEPRGNLCRYLGEKITGARLEHQRVLHDIEARYPVSAAEEGLTPPLSLADARRKVVASSDTAILSYFAAGERLLLWIVRSDEAHLVDLPLPMSRIEDWIERALRPFERFAETGADLALMALDPAVLRELGRALIDPALPRLGGVRRLLIVPWGMLHRLPFEMLALDAGTREGPAASLHDLHYLAEDFDLAYGPSASLLDPELRCDASAPDPAPRAISNQSSLVAWGDPAGGGVAGATREGGRGSSGLPGTRAEVELLEALFDNARIFVGSEARESAYRQAAPDADIIHLGCHGHLDDRSPLHSGLVLAPGESGAEGSLLQGYEIADIRLRNAPLVVLAACQAGGGPLSTGAGLLGLTRSFMQAGAGAVLASPWMVDDASTHQLLDAFYRTLASAGVGAMEALGRARRALLDTARADSGSGAGLDPIHPFHWASFRLHGIGARGR